MIVLIEIKLKASCLKMGRAFAMIVCQNGLFSTSRVHFFRAFPSCGLFTRNRTGVKHYNSNFC